MDKPKTTINQTGFGAYGLTPEAYEWIITFPKRFYHQLVCPDNPIWQARSWINWGLYDKPRPPLTWEQRHREVEQIVETKTETVL